MAATAIDKKFAKQVELAQLNKSRLWKCLVRAYLWGPGVLVGRFVMTLAGVGIRVVGGVRTLSTSP